jgi:hypothetical protein
MSLPVHRDVSPDWTLNPLAGGALSASSSENGNDAATQIDEKDQAEGSASGSGSMLEKRKTDNDSDGDMNEKTDTYADRNAYADKGLIEVDDEEGRKRQARLVLEQKSGREMVAEVSGGPYTQPRW